MNHAYRLVWSQAKNVWVVASEKTRGRGKSSSGRLSAVALALLPLFGQASPLGGMVTSGIGAINQSGNLTTITQSTQNLSINWKSFNIGSQQTVNFLQPSASAIAVNRIFDTNGTTILGHLNANGQVYLINPNGILFGQGAQVNVGGLVASTLDTISNNGSSITFSGNGTGKIINEGTIAGHYVALIGNTVSNTGTITANLGSAALGAGSSVTLTFSGNDLVHMQVDKGVLNALVANGGIIQADGGYLIMTAGAKDELLSSVVNNTGIVRAETVQDKAGNIVLLGGMTSGTVNVSGTLDASAQNGGNGGAIETSASHVEVANSAKITTLSSDGLTGSWLIDPNDFTVAASNGDITGAALSTALGSGAVTIQTTSGTASCTGVACTSTGTSGNGDIFVNDTVTWSANTLTLNAYRDIAINSTLNGSATAGLALKYGQGATNGVIGGVTSSYSVNAPVNLASTGSFSTQLGSGGSVVNYTIITALGSAGSTTGTDLQGINGGLSGNYVLGSNIDATGTSSWNANAGFTPIGNSTTQFTGTFDGLNHTISNLYISRSSSNYVGLFGFVGSNGTVRDVGLVGGSVKGSTYVGTLVGDNAGTISNAYATGGLYGVSTNLGEAGGLAGVNTGTISNAYATGNVSASGYFVGGLVGVSNGTISNAYATGSVSSLKSKVGGLVGNSGGPISNAYATGNVSGATYVGGLVGNNNFSTISNSYATGSVTGSSKVGGLVGANSGTVSNSFWNTTTSGQATSAGGAGLTTTQMQTQANFTSATAANGNVNPNWDFTTTPIWGFKSGANNGYPVLCAFYTCFVTTDVYVRLNSGLSSTYGNSPATFTWGYYTTSSGTTTVSVSPSGTPTWSNPISSTTGAGTYSETYSSGLSLTNYSFLAGSSVNYTVNATLTITSASSGQNSETTGSTIAQIDSNFSNLSSQPLNLNPSTTITSSTTPLQPAASTGGTSSGSGSGGDSSGPGVIGNTSLSIAGNGTLNIEHGGVKLPGNILSSNDGSNAQAN